MDPLSIATAALSAVKICGLVSWELRKFINETKLVDITIEMLIRDVTSFENILKLMHETVEDPTVKAAVGLTGRIGNFWYQLLVTLGDAEKVLTALRNAIARVNTNVTVLDSARKQLRLNFATDEITRYQQQITSYKDTLQILLNTTILWQQVTDKEATDKVIPRLDETQQLIRRLAVEFHSRMNSMEESMKAYPNLYNSSDSLASKQSEYKHLGNLKNSLRVAASIITSASTTLSRERTGRTGASSTIIDSDFGDLFPPDPSDLTLSWIETLSGSEVPPRSRREELQAINELEISDDMDTDDEELRQEMFQAFLRLSIFYTERHQYENARREIQNCVDQVSTDIITRKSLEIPSALLDAMSSLVKALIDQRRWDEAQVLLKEKLALLSRAPQKDESLILEDTYQFSDVLFQKGEFTESLLYAKKAERGYRKQKATGIEGRKKALQLVIKILTSVENGTNSAKGYRAILESISSIKDESYPSQGDASATLSMSSIVPQRNEKTVSPRRGEKNLLDSTQGILANGIYTQVVDNSAVVGVSNPYSGPPSPPPDLPPWPVFPRATPPPPQALQNTSQDTRKKVESLSSTLDERNISQSKTASKLLIKPKKSFQEPKSEDISINNIPIMNVPHEYKQPDSLNTAEEFPRSEFGWPSSGPSNTLSPDEFEVPNSHKLINNVKSQTTQGNDYHVTKTRRRASQEDIVFKVINTPTDGGSSNSADELYRESMNGKLLNCSKRSSSVEAIDDSYSPSSESFIVSSAAAPNPKSTDVTFSLPSSRSSGSKGTENQWTKYSPDSHLSFPHLFEKIPRYILDRQFPPSTADRLVRRR